MAGVGGSVVEVFDFVWARFSARISGLEDDEYYWEPVAGCWSLREDESGELRLDGAGGGGPPPDPVPITTIAWRLGHIGDLVLANFALRARNLPESEVPDQPARASGVTSYLADCYGLWREWLTTMPEERWTENLGPDWGPYGESSWLDLALHVLDELAHHGAEVGVLRDLYSQRQSLVDRATD